MEALTIKNLRKIYEGNLVALKGINLNVEEGDFFALLGPNGAGKTTTIGIISSLVTKTSGEVKVLGIDIDEEHSLLWRFEHLGIRAPRRQEISGRRQMDRCPAEFAWRWFPGDRGRPQWPDQHNERGGKTNSQRSGGSPGTSRKS